MSFLSGELVDRRNQVLFRILLRTNRCKTINRSSLVADVVLHAFLHVFEKVKDLDTLSFHILALIVNQCHYSLALHGLL